MKAVLYGIILVLVLLAPVKKEDIGDLEPIQAVWLYIEDDHIALKTDTDDYGAGQTVEDAIHAMKENSEGVVYLDTAQFLLVSENALPYMTQLTKALKDSVKICLWEGNDVKSVARYMQSHDVGYKMKELNRGKQLQTIPQIAEKEKES